MSDFITKTDTLSAVNTMLSCAGETPVSAYDDETNLMAKLALQTLVEVHRAVLSKGWSFNIDDEYQLTPDEDKKIAIGSDIVSIDVNSRDDDSDPVIRGGYLYSRKNQSFEWDNPISATVIRLFEFDDIPEAVKNYIKIRAARTFVQRHVGDDASYTFTANDEAQALADIKSFELKQGDYNIFNKWSVARILDRSPRKIR